MLLDEVSRASISKLDANLSNLVAILAKILPKLEAVKGGDLVVCVGNNGCGKSTTLSSLVHGTESLHLVMKEYFVDVNG